MEKVIEDWVQKNLRSELNEGKELALKLMNHLQPSSSSHATRLFLIEKLLSSYEKSLSMLNYSAFQLLESPNSFPHNSTTTDPSTAPNSFKGSGHDNKHKADVFKKRKVMPRWSEQVKASSESGLEGPMNDDGYSWRKYGQKDILGAKFPRGYYRCTHRPAQGCWAKKQVQRSDQDPTIFQIVYTGIHTCTQAQSSSCPTSPPNKKPKSSPTLTSPKTQTQEISFNPSSSIPGLTVKTQDLDTREDYIRFPSFCFTSPSNHVSFGNSGIDNIFLSPSTSESNYFSHCHIDTTTTSFKFGHNVQTSESDLTDIISAPTSVSNSPICDIDFSLDHFDIDAEFPFDNLEFFS